MPQKRVYLYIPFKDKEKARLLGAMWNDKSKQKNLCAYEKQEKGFEVYKYYKEKNIKQVADYYFGRIPTELYDALYRYEVEITD